MAGSHPHGDDASVGPCCSSDDHGPSEGSPNVRGERVIGVAGDRYLIGDCIPDGAGGCKRSSSQGQSCCKSGAGPTDDASCVPIPEQVYKGGNNDCEGGCCDDEDCADSVKNDADVCGGDDACCESCEDLPDSCCGEGEAAAGDSCDAGCCSGAPKESGSVKSEEDDDCCSDCGSVKVESKSLEKGCCSDCVSVKDETHDERKSLDKGCCSDCVSDKDETLEANECKSLDKGCCSDTINVAEDSKSSSDVKSIAVPSQVVRRRAHHHHSSVDEGKRKKASEKARHKHAHKHHKHQHARHPHDAVSTAMGRFYEAACCCLVDWARARRRPKPAAQTKECCSNDDTAKKTEKVRDANKGGDVELGGGRRLTMVMSVEGMDCPSCANKVTRALLKIKSVRDVTVNVFAGQATFAYSEGLAFPQDIAKRAGELTGFTCGVLEESIPQGDISIIRVRVPPNVIDKIALPKSVHIKATRSTPQGAVLELEYNSLSILPRDVVLAFSQWGGVFVPTPKVSIGEQTAKELRALFLRSLVSVLFCVPVLILSWAPLPAHPVAYGAACLALSTVIQVYAGYPIYSAALRSLFLQRILDMDLLVVLSTSIAYVFSIVAYALLVSKHDFSSAFFETSSLLLTLITLGRLLSAYARRFASSALDQLYMLQVDTVDLVDADGHEHVISTELVHKGDILKISQNSLVPTDGVVHSGVSHVDEAAITGESIPVEKMEGSRLTAGTLNGPDVLYMRVERLPSDNTVAEIGKLMLGVQNQRLPVQDLADKIASYLAPTILALSVLTFVVWIAVCLRVRHDSTATAGVTALRYAIAVMVVSCPCALVLCVPMVVVITTAVASNQGVLFKSAEAVQYAKDINVAVFDKTGTLTTGVLAVADSHILNDSTVSIILSLIAGSRHPVSQAVFNFLVDRYPTAEVTQLSDIVSLPGRGLECNFNGLSIRGGNPAWLNVSSHEHVEVLQSKAYTIFAVTIDSELVAAFGLSDTLRPDARATVELLEKRGTEVYIVSGDSQRVVDALAMQLHIPAERAFGGCLPQDKLVHVRELQNGTAKKLMFLGDGTNDALALAQANLGVSFSSGTSVAASAASVLLLNPSLLPGIQTILALSRGASRRIWVNFAWAFVYNTIAVLGAAGAFVNFRIAPEYAGLGEMVSVLPVVIIAWSIRLLKC